MGKYRKKSVVIEAMLCRDLFRAALYNWDDLPEWAIDAYSNDTLHFLAANKLNPLDPAELGIDIVTLEGTMHAEPEDWIIRGVKGELYPCKPDIFEETYEKA